MSKKILLDPLVYTYVFASDFNLANPLASAQYSRLIFDSNLAHSRLSFF